MDTETSVVPVVVNATAARMSLRWRWNLNWGTVWTLSLVLGQLEREDVDALLDDRGAAEGRAVHAAVGDEDGRVVAVAVPPLRLDAPEDGADVEADRRVRLAGDDRVGGGDGLEQKVGLGVLSAAASVSVPDETSATVPDPGTNVSVTARLACELVADPVPSGTTGASGV